MRASPTVRVATLADAADLARLRWQMHAEVAVPEVDLEDFSARFVGFVDHAIHSGMWRIWVIEGKASLVGNLWLQLVERVPRPTDASKARPIGYVTNVYVEEPYRSTGIGSAMLNQVVDWSRAQPLALLIVWPSDRSLSFYRRAGFESKWDPLVAEITRQD